MGRLEGQQGNAMSNRDFEKLMQIVRPTRASEEVFYTQIADYFGGRLSILNSQADQFMNSDRVQSFTNTYGYSPYINMDNPVQYVDDYLANPNNKGANKDMVGGYNFIMQRKDLGWKATDTATEIINEILDFDFNKLIKNFFCSVIV